MFRGSFNCKSASKGRVKLPSAYRSHFEDIQQNFVVTNSQYQNQKCLDAYLLQDWEKLEQKISNLPGLNIEVQAFQRFYMASGQLVEPDGQGRILIPHSLRNFSNIEGQAVLIGMGKKFEIWSEEVWNGLHQGMAENFEHILNSVSQFEVGRS